MRREWIEMTSQYNHIILHESPSMRREWIEIRRCRTYSIFERVSLHAEGVD